MLTFPTRANFVEIQLGSSIYGSKLMYDLNQAMIYAMKSGKKSVHFKYDPASQHDSKSSGMNELFVEHLRSKKYRLKDVTKDGFVLIIR